MQLPSVFKNQLLQPSSFERVSISWQGVLRAFLPIITLVLLVCAWQVVVILELYPVFIVPTPLSVFEKFLGVTFGEDRVRLLPHVFVTLHAVLLGLMSGLVLGFALGYVIAKVEWLEQALSPIIIAFQATPVVAYAPLLVIWFGSGTSSKVITSALIVFFPTLMNVIIGIRSVPHSLYDLMYTLHASRRQILFQLELPASAPVVLGGMKISATLAVIGAVVGEFVGAKAGLGFLITLARNQFDTPLVIVAVFSLTVMALTLYGLVGLVERNALAWKSHAS
ncbi:MAG: ABC transporter permease [Phototrophicaceae bacterium]